MKYKQNIIPVLLCIFTLSLLFNVGFQSAVADDDFSSLCNKESPAEGDILVIKLESAERNLVSGRAVGVVDAPVDTVWEVLSDYNNYQNFLPRLDVTYMVDKDVMGEFSINEVWTRSEFESLLSRYRTDRIQGERLYFYNVLDIPFPMADLWFLLDIKRNPRMHSFSWKLVYGNMQRNEGSWELKPCGRDNSKTLASYTTTSDPGVYVPQFLESFALRSTLPNTIKGLRKRARQINLQNK